MKDNNTSSTKLFDSGYYIIWQVVHVQITKNKWHKIDPCSTLKKTKNNKIRKCILSLSHFLAEFIHAIKYRLNFTKVENWVNQYLLILPDISNTKSY